ncbi:hypothetical protein [Carp edema virus]|nr:hypothetical protein [Carp edema virus]
MNKLTHGMPNHNTTVNVNTPNTFNSVKNNVDNNVEIDLTEEEYNKIFDSIDFEALDFLFFDSLILENYIDESILDMNLEELEKYLEPEKSKSKVKKVDLLESDSIAKRVKKHRRRAHVKRLSY